MPAINISTTITMASFGDIPRIRISSKMLGSSSESAGRFLMSSNVLLMYFIDVLKCENIILIMTSTLKITSQYIICFLLGKKVLCLEELT